MAGEYLRRTPTSTGNQRVFTVSLWVKKGNSDTGTNNFFRAITGPSNDTGFRFHSQNNIAYYSNGGSNASIQTISNYRDLGSWIHILASWDTTLQAAAERYKLYVNGAKVNNFSLLYTPASAATYDAQNALLGFMTNGITNFIGSGGFYGEFFIGEMFDYFYVDGQALTPDVFGFNKQGKGYISAGSAQATDFRPGQWVPKSPRVIKTEINRRGGFGANGFYLPMNDSRNFGADFHCDPNTIIRLNEDLPQPRVGIASTASVGFGYTDALRSDPYAQNLVLSVPFVSGGLNSGFGDYSSAIRGNGSSKTGTLSASAPSIGSTASHYGSSVQFIKSSSQNITYPSASDFTFGTGDFTIEYWVNYSQPTDNTNFETIVTTATPNDNQGIWMGRTNAGNTYALIGNGSFWTHVFDAGAVTPTGQWNHVALTRRGTIGTLYLNGVAVGIKTNVTENLTNSNNSIVIGGRSTQFSNSYIQDLRVYKGVAKYSGSFDVSKPYAPVGIATWRAVSDTTTNNFAALNPLYQIDSRATTFINGNLKATSTTDNTVAQANVGVSTGKWYWETRIYSDEMVGIGAEYGSISVFPGSNVRGLSLHLSGNVYYDGITSPYASSRSTNTYTIIGCALDVTNKKIYWSYNGTWQNSANPSVGTNGFDWTNVGLARTTTFYVPSWRVRATAGALEQASVNFGQNPTFGDEVTAGTFTDSNGKGLFKYQPPTGFLALCEDNLPTPAISDPGKHFKTVLWTGTSSSRNITGLGFQPDLVWIKNRTTAYSHYIADSVRKGGLYLVSSSASAEISDVTGVTDFNSDGFSIGSLLDINRVGNSVVAWCWRAGAGTTSTNTDGSITSVVSVNRDAGFSIVSYTGNGVEGATIGHGLGKAPKFILAKVRNAVADWRVWHSYLGDTYGLGSGPVFLSLNLTDAARYDSQRITGATSTTFRTTGTATPYINSSGNTFIAYCWAEIEGFSKFGSYVGNGSADGPFVYCGFKPAWIMIKNITDNTGWFWAIGDSSRSSTNPDSAKLYANNANVEDTTSYPIDYLSNGFKIRTNQGTWNLSGSTHIFVAFAESPFTTANAK